MIRNQIPIASLAVLALVSSCKKHRSEHPVKIDDPLIVIDTTYTALWVGNYWVYQQYKIDSVNGAAHALGIYDSCFVDKDTVVNGLIYHKYNEPEPGLTYPNINYQVTLLRDSGQYTINQDGKIVFATDNFSDTFSRNVIYPSSAQPDTLMEFELMGFRDSVMHVNAGTFTTRTFRRVLKMPPTYPYGSTRSRDASYAKGLGIVRKTLSFYYASPESYEWRLERYHVH